MPIDQIRFDDGTAYERYMGTWSQLVGESFLQWIAPETGLRWLDIGCGNGAFTEMVIKRCAPRDVHGIDPSEGQLAYARSRLAARIAQFQRGDAMALPFADDSFDVAVMPLVIFFVPDPAKGVVEMARVVCAGGTVSAYAWDMPGGGFPYQALHDEIRLMGIAAPTAPNPDVSRMDVLLELWKTAGLLAVETEVLEVRRTFADFEDYWETVVGGATVSRQIAAMSSGMRETLKAKMRQRLPTDAQGKITLSAHANAVKGRVGG
ncbi:MAG TPA: class I SAM-dependent methyltransferase [Tepidisphaeraceae bacterium]|nr:class I SAM-dependent methyltransferase [Tepidisphaeraceae bacterium]